MLQQKCQNITTYLDTKFRLWLYDPVTVEVDFVPRRTSPLCSYRTLKNVPVKFGEMKVLVQREGGGNSCAPPVCSSGPSVVPARASMLCAVRRRGGEGAARGARSAARIGGRHRGGGEGGQRRYWATSSNPKPYCTDHQSEKDAPRSYGYMITEDVVEGARALLTVVCPLF